MCIFISRTKIFGDISEEISVQFHRDGSSDTPKLTKRFKRNMSYRAADENIIAVYSSEVAAATCQKSRKGLNEI